MIDAHRYTYGSASIAGTTSCMKISWFSALHDCAERAGGGSSRDGKHECDKESKKASTMKEINARAEARAREPKALFQASCSILHLHLPEGAVGQVSAANLPGTADRRTR